MSSHDSGELLTVPEAAEVLKVSAVTVSRWLKQGRLPAYRVGPRAVRIRRADIDHILAPAVATANGTPESPYSTRATSGQPVPEPEAAFPSRADRLAVNDEAMALRSRILARRRGQVFASATDDLAKARQKRRKRR
jgi:excisionase family DNA binding protein